MLFGHHRHLQFLALLAALSLHCYAPPAAALALVPLPQSMEVGDGAFVFTPSTCLKYDQQLAATASYLREVISPATGFALASAPGQQRNCVTLVLDKELPAEAYVLEVNARGIGIKASANAGAFYALQSLRQLLPTAIFSDQPQPGVSWQAPAVVIKDQPRFPWRGMHLDVGRHFMPVATVKKFLDVMAMHKMNRFHWHLTEDQGWRIEIRKYPRLVEVGSCRKETQIGRQDSEKYDGKAHCGYYTQEQIRDVVAHAAKLHITVVPEIEMPGHSQAAIAAYPELGNLEAPVEVKTGWGVSDHSYNVEESTFEFLQNVLLEVMALFPGEYIHIGGDEVRPSEWAESPKAQQKILQLGLAGEKELAGWFVGRMEKFLRKHGRRLVGWDEIFQDGLAKSALIMPWRGEWAGVEAVKAGHEVVMAPVQNTYFDCYQGSMKTEPLAQRLWAMLEWVYHYDPVPSKLKEHERQRVLGAQGQLWTELIQTPEHLEYMAYPRAAALAEVLWLPLQEKNYDDFLERLNTHLERLDQQGVNYRPLNKGDLGWLESLKARLRNFMYQILHRYSLL